LAVEPIRFFFGQHIPFAVANGLRQRGIDVLTAQEAGRCGLPDTDQLQFATAQGRVMVTFDRDYLLLDASSVSHAGIAWCLANKYSIGQLISALLLVHSVLSCDEMRNPMEFL
jgi:predicted nuclease of predicted toxin-antitoxin system